MHRRAGTDREAFNILSAWLQRTKHGVRVNTSAEPLQHQLLSDGLISVSDSSFDSITEATELNPGANPPAH